MAPTSLDEERGEVVLALVVMCRLSMKCRLVNGWGGGGTSKGARGYPKCGMDKCGKAGVGRVRAFLSRTAVPKAVDLVVPRTSRVLGR